MIKVNDSRSVIFLLENIIIVYHSQVYLCDFSIEGIELGFEVPSVRKKFLGVKMTEKNWLWGFKDHETRAKGSPASPILISWKNQSHWYLDPSKACLWTEKHKNKIQHYNWELNFIWGQNENYGLDAAFQIALYLWRGTSGGQYVRNFSEVGTCCQAHILSKGCC